MIELSTDQQRDGLRSLARAVVAEADGKQLKRELAAELRKVMEPIRARQVARIMAIPSKGHPGPSLRQAVAKQTRAGVRFGGRNAGVNITQRARAMPREFRFAGRALNREEGWQPQTPGGVKLTQHARPVEWFDQPGHAASRDATHATQQVLERMAQRLADRARARG